MAADSVKGKTLVTKLKRHRIAKGMTQTALAKKCGVAPSAISNWESGLCLPSPSRVPLLARLLDIPAMELTRLIAPEDERPAVTA